MREKQKQKQKQQLPSRNANEKWCGQGETVGTREGDGCACESMRLNDLDGRISSKEARLNVRMIRFALSCLTLELFVL